MPFNLNTPLIQHVIQTLIVVVVLWFIDKVMITLFHRRSRDVVKFYHLKKSIQYFFVTIGFIIILGIWFSDIKSLSTFLGLISAGIAIALRDPLVNIAAWFFIMWRKPFEAGDRISVSDVSGDVIDQRLFQFSLNEINGYNESDQSTGRVIHVPNSKVFSDNIINFGQGFAYIWNEISIMLTFESNWEKAKVTFLQFAEDYGEKLSLEAEKQLKESAKKYMIYYNKLTPIVYTSIKESGVVLTIRYLCEPRRRRSSSEKINEAVLKYVASQDDLDFAYPTHRIVK